MVSEHLFFTSHMSRCLPLARLPLRGTGEASWSGAGSSAGHFPRVTGQRDDPRGGRGETETGEKATEPETNTDRNDAVHPNRNANVHTSTGNVRSYALQNYSLCLVPLPLEPETSRHKMGRIGNPLAALSHIEGRTETASCRPADLPTSRQRRVQT